MSAALPCFAEVGSQPSAETSRLAAEIRSMVPDHPLLEATKDSGRHFANVPAAPNRWSAAGKWERLKIYPGSPDTPHHTDRPRNRQDSAGARVTTRMVEEYANGVVFVPTRLSSRSRSGGADSPQLLDPGADLAAPSLESLIELLRRYELLLVLDNFEQILGAAPIVARCSSKLQI